jgi:ABC-type phosphate transport system substrate-binding protein
MRGALLLAVAVLAANLAHAVAPVQGRGSAPPAGEAIAIIVHRSNPVDTLSFAELRRIFLLERQTWPQGRKVTLVLREPGQQERIEVIALVVAMSEPEFERHVLFQTFRGNVGWGPRSIRSAEAMRRFVYNAPGAIGHVYANELDDSIKALRIDGLSHDDPRYRLRRRAKPAVVVNEE